MDLNARVLLLALSAALAAAADPCECLNWAQVYQAKRVLCGEGYEWGPAGPVRNYEGAYWAPLLMGFTWHEFCGSFFHRMDNSYCVNVKHHTYDQVGVDAEQWCYVSRECADLNGGEYLPDQQGIPELPQSLLTPWTYNMAKALYFWPKIHKRDVAVKLCTPGKDKLISDLGVEKVVELGQKMDSVVGFVVKTAFPMARRNELRSPHWEEVKDAVAKGDVDALPAPIKQAVRDEKPIVVDIDPEGHTHQRILVGKKVFELDNICDNTGCGALQWPFRRGRDMGEL